MASDADIDITRRRFLGAAAIGGAVAAGSHALGDVSAAAASAGVAPSAEPTPDQAMQLVEVARRIRSGDGVRLFDGIVVIDGWFLPAEYVVFIDRYDDGR